MIKKSFAELGLSPDLLKAIDRLGFEQPAPIQAESIPVLLQGKDVVGQSQTGSGKTAAFGLPAIELVKPEQRDTQVLILCPTRELAVQVSEEVHKLAFFKRGLRALPIYGGQSYDRQLFGLKQGAHVVIGTPGRVMDHMRRGTLRLDTVRMVILDEVDVMLNMGFRDDIELILQSTPAERQTVFFSATIPRPIQQLIEKYSRDPQSIRIEQKALTVPTVEQVYYEVDRRYKVELLTRLIDVHDLKLGIIFCNTKRMVDDLVDSLNAQGYSADRLHGDMSQMMRDRVMNKFRKSGLEFLVATDVAARGIDVDDVEVVFNYDLPYDAEDYVHRIGRTGRQGREGRAISFVSGREVFQIRNIERYTNMRIQRGKPPTLDEVEEARENVVLDKVREALKAGDFKRQDHMIERLLEEGFSSTDISSALLFLLQGGDAPREAAPAPKFEDRMERREPPSRDRGERGPRREDEGYRERRRERTERAAPAPREFRAPRPAPSAQPVSTPVPPVPAAPPAKPEVPVAKQAASVPVAPASLPEGPVAPQAAPSVRPPTPQPPAKRPQPVVSEKENKKASRRTPAGQTRLHINVGEEMGVNPGDVVGAIMGETGLPAKAVGHIDVRERHLFVDVASEHANSIIAKLNRAQLKGRKMKVKLV
jgi:ATP-dependent RNA helicase DeaD